MTKKLRASLLAIGDELIIGQVINSNTSFLAEQLVSCGVEIMRHVLVRDRPEDIREALEHCRRDSDLILMSGGLGPTHDDLTMAAVAQYLQVPMVFDGESFKKIEGFFARSGRVATANNRKQAYFPEGARILENYVGTAPGAYVEVAGKGLPVALAVLPGVPHELQEMWYNSLLPLIRNRVPNRAGGNGPKCKTLLTGGLGESRLAETVDPWRFGLEKGFQIAFLPNIYGVRIRLTATDHESESRFDVQYQRLKDLLVDNAWGEDGDTLATVIGRMLKDRGLTLAAMESCTGGLLLQKLTAVAGASEWIRGGMVVYHSEYKSRFAGVDPALILTGGPVSEAVAVALAKGAVEAFGSSLGIGVTGYSGPGGGDEFAKVGEMWIAVVIAEKTVVLRILSPEIDRLRNQERAAHGALFLLWRLLNDTPEPLLKH